MLTQNCSFNSTIPALVPPCHSAVRLCMCVYIYSILCICIYIYIILFMCIYIYHIMYVHIYIILCMCIYIYIYIILCMCIYILYYVCVRIYILYIHVYYIYVCVWVCVLLLLSFHSMREKLYPKRIICLKERSACKKKYSTAPKLVLSVSKRQQYLYCSLEAMHF